MRGSVSPRVGEATDDGRERASTQHQVLVGLDDTTLTLQVIVRFGPEKVVSSEGAIQPGPPGKV